MNASFAETFIQRYAGPTGCLTRPFAERAFSQRQIRF